MVDRRLVKLFAWVIGVLIVLWMLTECLGGADDADPDIQDLDRDTEQYAADCDRTWQALDLAADVDHGNVDAVLDQIDTLGTEIEDPNLKALTADFAQQAQEMVSAVQPEDADGLEDARIEFRDGAALDLAMRCPLR
jgi:hypothetical protein